MLLHTVNKSPFLHKALESCLRSAKDGCAVLLIEDGVYGALKGTEYTPVVEGAMKTKKFYALDADLKARGVQDSVINGVEVVDYKGFVELTAQHSAVQSWL